MDYLRALAIITVIFTHIPFVLTTLKIDYSFVNFANPVFLMLSGALLLNKDYNLSDFLKKRFPRILFPLFFWGIILFLSFIILTIFFKRGAFESFGLDYSNLYQLIFSAIYRTSVMDWYPLMIVGIYLSLPIINSFVLKEKMEGVKYYLILWFSSTFIYGLYLLSGSPQIIEGLNLLFIDLNFFISPLGFFFLGYYLHKQEFKYSPRTKILLSLILFTVSTILGSILFKYINNDYLFNYRTLLTHSFINIDIFTILQSIGIFILIKNLNSLKIVINNHIYLLIKKWLISLSRSSYGIYLSHCIIMNIIIAINVINMDKYTYILIPFIMLIVLISTHILIYSLNKVQKLKKFTGYH
ncbi:MAG: acyltransferase family protein [Methanobrevibacter sp.]|nr:acyltransferase family protein [Methanobrevibacter sp.]